MGVCYTIIMMDEFDWGYSNTDKNKKIKEFELAWQKETGSLPDLVGQWYGAMVFDLDKKWPFTAERRALIKKFSDNWYYIADNQLTSICHPVG